MNFEGLEGYEEATSHECMGSDGVFGVKIFVKLSRPVDRDMDIYGNENGNYDHAGLSALADKALARLRRTSVLLDPQLPARQAQTESEFRALFETPIFLRRIPNEYCADPCCLHIPWFEVTTPVGLFKLGWRKRVIAIDWSQTVDTKNSIDLFAHEGVTMESRMIHAWSYADAKRYIAAIHSGIPLEKPVR